MRRLKKLLAVGMMFAVLFSAVPASQAFAKSEDEIAVAAVQPRYSNLQSLLVGFGVEDADGDAIADIVCTFYEDWTDSITVRVEFQRYLQDDGWTTFMTFVSSSDESPYDVEHSWYVTKGYAYRAVAYVDLYYNGSIVETVRVASDADYY